MSFSVCYEFKSRMCNLTFEFILHLYSFFVLFYPPRWRFVLQTEILGKYNSSFRWSKLPNLQMHRKLGFIWKTYAQPAIGVIGIPRGPRGCAQPKASKASSFWSSSRMRLQAPFSALTYIRENISFSRRSTAFWEVYPSWAPGELSMIIAYTATAPPYRDS